MTEVFVVLPALDCMEQTKNLVFRAPVSLIKGGKQIDNNSYITTRHAIEWQ